MDRLFDELYEPMFRYLLCLGLAPEEADEVVQESFLRLFRSLYSEERVSNIRGWLFRVAHNLAFDVRRARTRFLLPGPEQWEELNESNPDSGLNPEERLLNKERMVWLHRAMAGLPTEERQCLNLRAEGFRYREIAEILGITMSAVTETLRRAIGKLTRESHG